MKKGKENNTVWLGLAGDYVPAGQPGAVDHYTTKVGGVASFPGDELSAPHPASAVACKACGHVMPLVFQAYTPLENSTHGVYAPERTLYVHGCVRPGCGRTQGAWRAFCSQVHVPPQLNQQEQEPPAGQQQDSRQQPGSQEAAGQDGFGDDDFGRFEGDGAEAGGALDFADLNAALDDLASAAVQSQSSQQPQQTAKAKPPGSSKGAGPERAPLPSWHARRQGQPVLPEFYVVAEPEVQGQAAGISRAEHAHIKSLLLQYQQEDAMGSSDTNAGNGGRTNVGGPGGSSTAMECDSQEGGSEGSVGWTGEEYEEDSVRGVQPSYLKFSKRLLQRPEQCVRYCRGSQPLWPVPQAPEGGTCARCGAPRVFELQLMAPLISMIVEAGEALSEGSDTHKTGTQEGGVAGEPRIDAGAVNGAANWDLCTLAVFTCVQACSAAASQGGGCSFDEEYVVLVNEDACHVSDR